MSTDVFVHGLGAVSPAGWGVESLLSVVGSQQEASGTIDEVNPLCAVESLPARFKETGRRVPVPPTRPGFLAHPRLRRSSSISHYALAAALEAISADPDVLSGSGKVRLGIVGCVLSGSVRYSRRFFEEVLNDPSTASPMLFPETVFNAPTSHVAAYLASPARSYTLVGDDSGVLDGLLVGAGWLADGAVDACLVLGMEEADWLTADAWRTLEPDVPLSEGAGALYLKRDPTGALAQLEEVTSGFPFRSRNERASAAREMVRNLTAGESAELLCWSVRGAGRLDEAERAAWADSHTVRQTPKAVLGEALAAAGVWQNILAVAALRREQAQRAWVSIVGVNHKAMGATWSRLR